MKSFLLVCAAMAIAAVILLPNVHPFASASSRDTADTLRQLEADFMRAAAEHGSQGYLSYYAEGAVEVPNGAPLIQGKANIAKTMGFLDQKDNHLIWTPVGADIDRKSVV